MINKQQKQNKYEQWTKSKTNTTIYTYIWHFVAIPTQTHIYTCIYTCTFHPGNRIINHCGHMHTHTHTQRSSTTTWSGRRKHTSIWLYMHLWERHMHTRTRRGWHDVFRSTPSLRSVDGSRSSQPHFPSNFPLLEFVNSREWCIQTFWTFIFFACVRILNFLFSLLFLLLFSFLLYVFEKLCFCLRGGGCDEAHSSLVMFTHILLSLHTFGMFVFIGPMDSVTQSCISYDCEWCTRYVSLVV